VEVTAQGAAVAGTGDTALQRKLERELFPAGCAGIIDQQAG